MGDGKEGGRKRRRNEANIGAGMVSSSQSFPGVVGSDKITGGRTRERERERERGRKRSKKGRRREA